VNQSPLEAYHLVLAALAGAAPTHDSPLATLLADKRAQHWLRLEEGLMATLTTEVRELLLVLQQRLQGDEREETLNSLGERVAQRFCAGSFFELHTALVLLEGCARLVNGRTSAA
jgi:hypothetical protein